MNLVPALRKPRMNPIDPPPFDRRQFLQTAAAATVAGTWLSSGASRLCAAAPIRETEHFWFRLAPEGPYIDSQRDNKAFGFGDGKIFLSEDNGQTWAHSAAFPEAENITFSCLLKNGNILFATREKLFLSTDNLKTHPADHRQESRRQRLPAAHAAESRSARLVFPSARRRSHLGHRRHGNARVGELLQRARRAGAGEHLLLDRRRADGQDRLFLRPESAFPGEGDRARGRSSAIPATRSSAGTFTRWRTIRPSGRSMPAPATSIADTGTNATGCAAPTTRRPTRGTGKSWCP